MEITTTTQTTVFYTVVVGGAEHHFFTAWETLAFLAGTDLKAQLN